MLEVQKYLRAGHSLSSLRAKPYCLQIKEEGELAILKYNQVDSDFSEPICQECRGIILYKPTWDIVCFPFVKFFNFGEPFAANINEASGLHVYQKVDGSLAKVWYFEGAWRLSTNGVIDASEVQMNEGINFQSLFMKTLSTYGLDWQTFTSTLDQNYTYMYELATQDNKVVIKYEGYHLFYLGQRNIHTYQEEYIPDTRIDNVKVYNFSTIDEIIQAADELPDTEEGYVVRDNNWNRVKIKNPVYFLLHHIANNGKPDFVQYVYDNNTDELLAYFPEYQKDIDMVKAQFKKLETLAMYHKNNMLSFHSLSRKEFANLVFRRGIPVYLQSFVFKTYEDHSLTWNKYTKNWDIYKWKTILERAERDLQLL